MAELRILHVAQPVEAGVARVVRGLASHQAARGHVVAVACPSQGWLPDVLSTDAITRFRWEASRSPGPKSIVEAASLRRVISRFQPDVVHLHSAKAGLAGRLLGHVRATVVFQPHAWSFVAVSGFTRGLTSVWERRAQAATDLILCNSQAEAHQGAARGIRGAFVVPNGVDPGHFVAMERSQARRQLGLDPEARLVVGVGRFTEQKGFVPFVHAWREVQARMPDARLAFVGSGELGSLLRRVYQPYEATLADPADDPRPWYAAADLVVAPSLWEGAALVPLEAMSMERRVVGFDVGGLAQVLPDARGAVRPGDYDALAEILCAGLTEPDALPAEAEHRRHVLHHYHAQETFGRITAAVERRHRESREALVGPVADDPSQRSPASCHEPRGAR